jgi:hypothetical protein
MEGLSGWALRADTALGRAGISGTCKSSTAMLDTLEEINGTVLSHET